MERVDADMAKLLARNLACCPLLRRSGDSYSFLHKSLQDCFAALHMAHEIAQWRLQPPPAAGQLGLKLSIGEKFLTDDVGVLKFLAQLVDQRVWAYRRQGQAAVDADAAMQPLGRGLWDLVYESRRLQQQRQPQSQPHRQQADEAVVDVKLCEADECVVRGAANAISVLVCAGVSTAGVIASLLVCLATLISWQHLAFSAVLVFGLVWL